MLAYLFPFLLVPVIFLFGESSFSNCSITAPSAILINGKTGKVLFEKAAYQTYYPASLTKIATALLVLEKKSSSLEERVIADLESIKSLPSHLRRLPQEPPYRLEWGGSNIGLKNREALSLKTLLYGLLLCSGNDAANVIACHTASSIPLFMKEMNISLKSWGCRSTIFNNPHGLHHPEHYSTAYDLAQIAKEAMKYPLFNTSVLKIEKILKQ
jgi:serine-type D-Ala-D-Ala carboxypeptidase (penicillin-binding protein 5/6)